MRWSSSRRRPDRLILVSVALVAAACTRAPEVLPPSPSPSPSPTAVASPTPPETTYGGEDVAWPSLKRSTAAPPALGAVRTNGRTTLDGGGALPGGLTLPRVGGTAASPEVLTPCNRRVRLSGGRFGAIPPVRAGERLVLLDPGHGGQESGAVAPDGTKEADVVLALSLAVRDALKGSVGRIVLTRETDADRSLEFRVALGDALRASMAVSIHLNAVPDGPADHPGTSTFGSLADPNGRRAAGVLFEAERRYLDGLTPELGGSWASNRDAGALYRIGSRGDYYFQLRKSHVPWVISESLYITNPPETRLIARPDVRAGLAGAIAGGIETYLGTTDPGSGWRTPLPRPSGSGAAPRCTDPSA